jgi:AcrR family transcriptional regulator
MTTVLTAPSKRVQKARDVRDRILSAGRVCFSESGLYATRVDEITKRAGVAKGTFYLHFDSKEDLIRVVAEESFQELGARAWIASSSARIWPQRTSRIAEAHLEFFSEHPDRMRILHQLRGMTMFNDRNWRPLRRTLQEHIELLASLLRMPPAPPTLDARRARILAGLLFGAVSGATSVWASTEGSTWHEDRSGSLGAAAAGLANGYLHSERSRRHES